MQSEDQSTLGVIYESWRGYQGKLRDCIAPLTDEQLSLQPAPGWPDNSSPVSRLATLALMGPRRWAVLYSRA